MIKGARIAISHALNESLAPRAVNKKCEITYGRINKGRNAEKLESLLGQLDQMSENAFGPFSQQPLVRAALLLMGGFGWTVLIENGIVPGL